MCNNSLSRLAERSQLWLVTDVRLPYPVKSGATFFQIVLCQRWFFCRFFRGYRSLSGFEVSRLSLFIGLVCFVGRVSPSFIGHFFSFAHTLQGSTVRDLGSTSYACGHRTAKLTRQVVRRDDGRSNVNQMDLLIIPRNTVSIESNLVFFGPSDHVHCFS